MVEWHVSRLSRLYGVGNLGLDYHIVDKQRAAGLLAHIACEGVNNLMQ